MNSFIKKIAGVCLFAIVMLIIGKLVDNDPATHQISSFITEQRIDKTVEGWKQNLPKPPQVAFAENKNYIWRLRTNQGDITIELWPQYAPMHVSSTIYLSKLGFYDNLTFHRVIPEFMAQGGDPMGTGRGGPGYRYDGEFHKDATHAEAGILSMANAGPGSDGSQFFITFEDTKFLDGRHTVFGKVITGMETLKKIEALGSPRGKPQKEIKILTSSIIVKNKKQD
ncbi:peptidylprolyl isomerase [Thalassotalea maritima]|uniref:peptidylprolyl isomerase n=1 Tax=Thalassotalea maritima TaxID=3242416 RepID=UPI003528B867